MRRIFMGLALAGIAAAVPVQVSAVALLAPAAKPTNFKIDARIRNGRTGFEAVLFTPGDPSPGTGATQLNPGGAPVWKYGETYNFALNHNGITGATSFGIDFNRDGDFLDGEETALSQSQTLAGFGFRHVNLNGQGDGERDVFVSNFTLNGVSFGAFGTAAPAGDLFDVVFRDSTKRFIMIDAFGAFTFTGSASDERPRLGVRLGTPVRLSAATIASFGSDLNALGAASLGAAAVPEPASWALMIAGFAITGAARRRAMRRRAPTAA